MSDPSAREWHPGRRAAIFMNVVAVVLPSAVHLSGCAGDIAMVWVAARQPRGTTIEDLQTGVRFWN